MRLFNEQQITSLPASQAKIEAHKSHFPVINEARKRIAIVFLKNDFEGVHF